MEHNKEQHLAPHLLLGQIGEELAANWLMKNGFRIFHRNWKSRYGYELDIVAFKDNLLHIVEVKTRTDDAFREVRSALTREKVRRLCIGAGIYKRYHRLDFDYVIDGITILYHDEQHYDIEYRPNINAQFIRGRFYS